MKIYLNSSVRFCILITLFFSVNKTCAQNSLTGDGFGGRSWYVAHNYQVGAYTAYTVCGNNNQLYAWGDNRLGELGNGNTTSSSTPSAVTGMTDIKFYTTGYVSAAIKSDNTAWVWGSYDPGGPFASGFGNLPTQVLSDVKFVDAGICNVVFIKNDSTVWAVGNNHYGVLGNGTVSFNPVTIPVRMTGITNAVRAVVAGINDVAAIIILLADGTVKITGGWGIFQNINDTLSVPTTIPGLQNIVDIKANTFGAYALDSGGSVYSFGRNYSYGPGYDYPVLGLGTFNFDLTAPTLITFPAGAAPIVALSSNNDGYGALALDSNHHLYAWGHNTQGQLGDGTTGDILSPKLVATNVIDIFCGETFSYILKDDNTLWATGRSGYDIPGTDYGDIWMNLPNIQRNSFTQVNPLISPFNLCEPRPYGVICNLNVKLGSDTTLCEGQKITLHAGIDNASYLWQDGSIGPDFTVNNMGSYWINVSKDYCTSTDSINISFKRVPLIDLGRDTTICTTTSLDLNVSTADASYEWQDHSVNPVYHVTQTGTYWVDVNLDGCHETDSILVITKDCECNLKIPNAITPNGDGINDRWVFASQNCFRQFDVSVYNRYGNLVYKKTNYQNDWDGRYKLKTLPDATYYYVIKAIRFDGKSQNLKGSLTILR